MKKMNKIISLALAAIMTVSMSVAVSAETENVTVNEHFEGEIASSVWTGDYTVTDGVNKTITSVSDKAQFFCRPGATVESGAMIVSYDVMIPTFAGIRIKQVWDAAAGGKRAYLAQATSAGKITVNDQLIGTYSEGKWFNLTEVVDVTNKTVAVYLDGKYITECDWRNGKEASAINNIQTQYDGNTVYIDDAFVAAYADKSEATAALDEMMAGKVTLANSDFAVGGGKSVQNAITPVTDGAVVVSYDIETTGRARLMQIYDNQSPAKRAVLVQLNSSNVISVNGASTGVVWEQGVKNNLTLIYNAKDRTSTIYYNNILAGKENYAVHSDGGLNLADVRTQDEGGSGLTVSNAWAKAFSSYADAVNYCNAISNAENKEIAAHYNVNEEDVAEAIEEYGRALDAITYSAQEKNDIISKMATMLPYTEIFSENFDETTELSGYVANTGTEITSEKTLKLTNDGARARLLKNIAENEKLIVECDFMQDEISDVDCVVRITDNQGQKEAIKIYASNGDLYLLYGPKGEDNSFYSKVLVSNYSTDKWYNIKLCMDITTKKATVYMDDVFVGMFDFMYTDIENMRRAFDSYKDSAGSYYIDNIRIYNDDIMEAAAQISVASKLTENVSLPQTVKDYSCVWESSNENAVSADGTVTRPDAVSENVVLTSTVSNGVASVKTKFNTRAAALKEYEIVKVIYADANELSTEERNGAKGIKRVYINRNNDEINGSVIVAMYGADNTFIKAAVKEAKDGECAIGSSITEDVEKIKIFVWDANLTNGVPYANPIEIK